MLSRLCWNPYINAPWNVYYTYLRKSTEKNNPLCLILFNSMETWLKQSSYNSWKQCFMSNTKALLYTVWKISKRIPRLIKLYARLYTWLGHFWSQKNNLNNLNIIEFRHIMSRIKYLSCKACNFKKDNRLRFTLYLNPDALFGIRGNDLNNLRRVNLL